MPSDSDPNAETLDGVSMSDVALPTYENSTPQLKIHLVEGSGGHLSSETHSLLRTRIRASALVLFAGFALFFVWGIFDHRFDEEIEHHHWGQSVLLAMHLGVTAVLGASAYLLCNKCAICMRSLRIAELLVFGLPALFFLVMNAMGQYAIAHKFHVVPTQIEPWLILIFVYALFIPNTWQRAALVTGAISMLPILVRGTLVLVDPEVAAAAGGDWLALGAVAIMLGLAVFASSLGVYTIGNLRQEAFMAKQMGQYRLKHLIGVGGMGEVYLAEHLLMKRPCAIKVIRPEKAGDPTVLARFEREVRASAKLSHWNSIDIFDYGRADDGTFYYVMEFLPGMSLQDLVTKHGPLPPERVVYLLTQVCDALHEAHGAGIVHRDIKPANIFAAERGGCYDVSKLLDFGLAKPVSASDGDASLTQAGTVTGSPLFMSPEQATGDHEPDARSDIYSLGAVMYFLLTGKPPFEHEKPIKVMIAHATQEPIPLTELRPELPEDLSQVVARCLAKQPSTRFQTATELANALADCDAADRWTRDDATRWWLAHGKTSPKAEPVLA